MKTIFKIPTITESLKNDLNAGLISIEEAAAELYKANLLPYIDTNKAADYLKGENA